MKGFKDQCGTDENHCTCKSIDECGYKYIAEEIYKMRLEMKQEEEIYSILRKHRISLKKRELIIEDLKTLIQKQQNTLK